MEMTLFDKDGEPVAYIADDYHQTIYLWDGSPVAYLYEENHIYGINGRHLGWFTSDILYNGDGERIGFTNGTCPVSVGKETVKSTKQPMDEIRPRWAAPPLANLGFNFAAQGLADFLKEGQAIRYSAESATEESPD